MSTSSFSKQSHAGTLLIQWPIFWPSDSSIYIALGYTENTTHLLQQSLHHSLQACGGGMGPTAPGYHHWSPRLLPQVSVSQQGARMADFIAVRQQYGLR